MTNFEIRHQPEEELFYVLLDDGQRAYLKYRRSGDKSATSAVDLWSTFVPDSYRGKGLGAQIVEQGFRWAEAENLHIYTSCWYAAKKMQGRS